ncbi:MAG: hypothetical protein Q8M15_17395 [Bacteroidota bacterium]|nr:hypothetical protein [Bacteroidota bacterium]
MKNFLLLAVFALLAITVNAQNKENNYVPTPKPAVTDENGLPVEIKQAPKFVGRVYGNVGSVYDSEDMMNLPTRNVNKIAGLTLGVQTQNNATPIFKGAEGGTAYFVDGIRVRSGSLGIAGFGF